MLAMEFRWVPWLSIESAEILLLKLKENSFAKVSDGPLGGLGGGGGANTASREAAKLNVSSDGCFISSGPGSIACRSQNAA